MPDITTIIQDAESKMKKSFTSAQHEFATVRSGRAAPAMIEGVMVEHYGTRMPLNQLAAITAPEARLLVVQPWDQSAVASIEKAILQSGLGLTPQQDGKIIRIPIPQLTAERRVDLDKVVHKMAEDGRVSVRTVRRDANESLKQLKSNKDIAEDAFFETQERIQKLTDSFIKQIDEILKQKEQEIAAV
jgi:ribosome recycling factor